MKHNKRVLLILSIIGSSVLASCNLGSSTTTSTTLTSVNNHSSQTTGSEGKVDSNQTVLQTATDEDVTSTISTTSTDGYKYGRNVFDKYMSKNGYYSEALNSSSGKPYMPSTGTSKILVVPVLFSDTTKDSSDKEDMRSTIYNAFFGEEDATGWQSVRSYYYESSYHQLLLEGAVSPCVTLNNKFSYYAGTKTSSSTSRPGSTSSTGAGTDVALQEVYNALFTGTDPLYSVSDFDSNGDGIIDGIYLINEADINSNLSSGVGWAYTTWYANSSSSIAALGTYSWSSIQFATYSATAYKHSEYTSSTPDAHTFIHETGHQLGLDDYYDTSSSSSTTYMWAGANTMQDYNVCDHESYSKYLFGWTSPTVITGNDTRDSITVTLKPFEDSGDSIVLASSRYNGTSLDEYIIIDYYTPTGLNKQDSESKYESVQGIDGSGIRVWHVDKRIYESYISGNYIYYTPNSAGRDGTSMDFDSSDLDTTNRVTDFYNSYSANDSSSIGENFIETPELTLLRKGGNADKISKAATSDDLFVQGDTFGKSTDAYGSFSFYQTKEDVSDTTTDMEYNYVCEKASLPYYFTISSLSDTEATLTFTRK